MTDKPTTEVARYLMNPAEDVVIFGEDLAEDMWVLPENGVFRSAGYSTEDEQIRGQRFRRVTRLRREGHVLVFIGEWVDGYQERHAYAKSWCWIVRRDSIPGAETPAESAS